MSYILGSPSRRTLSSDEAVAEDDIERGGVESGVTTFASERALASAWETAERYEAALAGRLDVALVIFLNIECEGETGLIAMGEGISQRDRRKTVGLNILVNGKYARELSPASCRFCEGGRGRGDGVLGERT